MDSTLLESILLRNLCVNEKNNWILCDEAPRKFFQYLAATVDDSNVLDNLELELYKDLCQSGQFQSGGSLTEELIELESSFPGIMLLTEEQIEEMKEELEFLEADNVKREERITSMEGIQKCLLKEIEVIRNKSQELNYQEKISRIESLEKANQLVELQKSNQQSIFTLSQIYTQPVSID